MMERPAVRAHARPRRGEPIGLEPELLHDRHVLRIAVVVVARDVPVVPVKHGAGHAAESIPDGGAAAVFEGGTLDLERRRRGAESEARREGTRAGPLRDGGGAPGNAVLS